MPLLRRYSTSQKLRCLKKTATFCYGVGVGLQKSTQLDKTVFFLD